MDPPCGVATRFREPLAVGVEEKLENYCLAADHPVGCHKARVFRSALGFEQQDAISLAACLTAGAGFGAPVRNVRSNGQFGVLCEVLIVVDGIRERRGHRAAVVTVWELKTPQAPPRLVTAYVDL